MLKSINNKIGKKMYGTYNLYVKIYGSTSYDVTHSNYLRFYMQDNIHIPIVITL